MKEIIFCSPDDLAQKAADAGLLEPAKVEQMIRERLHTERSEKLHDGLGDLIRWDIGLSNDVDLRHECPVVKISDGDSARRGEWRAMHDVRHVLNTKFVGAGLAMETDDSLA